MTPSSAIRLDNLRKMVELHETYWRATARQSPYVTAWIERAWEPWLAHASLFQIDWAEVPSEQVPGLLIAQAESLQKLREQAAAQGVPLPDLSAARPQLDPHTGVPYDLTLVDASVDKLNRIANERFWRETGYKPGHRLSRTDQEDVRMMPVWTRIRHQVTREAAQQAGREAANVLTGQDASTTLSPATRLANIRKLIALHETYWRGLALQNPQVASWIVREWAPWLADWQKIDWTFVPAVRLDGLLTEKDRSLYDLRRRAFDQEIPSPDLEAVYPLPTTPRQPDQLVDPGLTSAYLDKIFAADKLNKITNERFWTQTGYKRGHKLSYRDPDDVKMMPVWTRIRRQVEQEQAAQGPIEMVAGEPITYEGLTFHPLTSTVINAHPDLDPWRRDELVLQRGGGGWIDMEGRQQPAKLIRSVCQQGDQLYFWNGPWGTLSGSRGIAIVRNGRVVETFTTLVS